MVMGSYELPPVVDESSMGDITPHPEDYSSLHVTYEVVQGGTKRGKDKLVDSHGFSYTQKRSKATYEVDWACSANKVFFVLISFCSL